MRCRAGRLCSGVAAVLALAAGLPAHAAAALPPPAVETAVDAGTPVVIGAATMLGVSLLFVWRRRGDALAAASGSALLAWALLLAVPALAPGDAAGGLPIRVWVGTLQGLVAALAVWVAVRLAGWRWRVVGRWLPAGLVAAPPLLHVAAAGWPAAAGLWQPLLLLAGAVAVAALLAATRGETPLRRGMLLLACAALAATASSGGTVIAGLLPYAGLLLAVLLAARVADRGLQAERGLHDTLADLRRQLAAQAAAVHAGLERMRGSRDAARAADQSKTRLLAAASHDLRQPAHALGLYLAALRESPLPPAQAEIAERMGVSLAALESMFGALLDVSRIDAGGVAPRWDLVPLAPLLRRLADEWAPQAEARGLRLSLRLADADALAVSDAVLLERVLRNLLANAVQYTARGGVLLACRPRSQPGGGRAWRIEVWDTGVGIAAADQEQAFEAFVRVGRNGRGTAPGTGLGLAIVRRLAGLLQLRLVLHSVPGRGSAFMLDGLTAAGQQPLQAAAARDRLRRLAGTRVAVIEDDADVLDAMRRLLLLWDCRVLAGRDADDILRQPADASTTPQPAQAIVADVRLGDGRRGPDEARRLQDAWGCRVPLLLVSGETEAPLLQQLQSAGHTCLAKPVSPARLRAWLEQAVEPTVMETRQ